MITIGTNIFHKLSLSHKNEIRTFSTVLIKDINQFELMGYEEDEATELGVGKFFIGNFPIYKITEDIKLWDSFIELLKNIFIFARQDVAEVKEVQFFVMFTHISTPINIFFSVKDKDSLLTLTLSLREELTNKVFKDNNLETGKIIVLGYNNEDAMWQLNYL